MNVPRRRRKVTRVRLSVLTILGTCAALLLWQLPASALDVTSTPTPVTGNATWFAGLGGPYGGCGMPQENLDSQDFVALNVYNTPGSYEFYNRPLTGSDLAYMGMWNNGHNCGRYVQVTIGDYCTGVNDGAQSLPFCRNGSWISDKYNGATLTMEVADSCGDSNAWCRDDPYHLDLGRDSLNRFLQNGVPVGDMDPDHWNNRHISWQFVQAPNYTGDIKIGLLQSAQTYWPAISVSHLANGIHGVQYWANGRWNDATMDGDMGQAYIVGPVGASTFQIRVLDANDTLINNGRVYTFSFPASCATSCNGAYTEVSYTTATAPTGSGTGSGSGTPTGTCTATQSVTNSWPGGYQAQFTVTNTGTSTLSGWTASLAFPGTQTIRSSWNATVTQTGQQVTATSLAYNGNIAAGGSTTWGMIVDGANDPLSTLTCAAS